MGDRGLEVFGSSLAVLPWRSPREAREALDVGAREDLARLEASLDDAWSTEDPIRTFCEAFRSSAQGVEVVVHAGAVSGPPAWTLSSIFRGYRGTLPSNEVLPRFRAYGAYGERASDPFANRPVNLRDLAVAVGPSRVDQITEELFQPIGLFHQLRTVLYDRSGRVTLLAGYYRARGGRPFDVEDHARLYAVQPALRRWVRLAKALGFQPVGEDGLATALRAMSVPAVLVDRGRVVFANDAARLTSVRAGVTLADLGAAGRPIHVRSGGVALDLVVGAPVEAPAPDGEPLTSAVPRYLQPIVALLREGLADKEIAARLALPLTTARTYVQRALAACGVQSRRALMLRR